MNAILFIMGWAVRSSTLILSGALLLWALRVRDTSIKLAVWTAILMGSLSIPLLSVVLPELPLVIVQKVSAPVMSTAHPFHTVPVAIPSNLEESSASAPAAPLNWPGTALLLYVSFVFVLLLRVIIGLILSSRLLRRSRPIGIASVQESDEVRGPVTVGILRPTVLLPSDWRDWDSLKLKAVLAHEYSHIQRRDPAVQLLSAIHRALLWGSPLSWMLDRWIVRAAEEVSDDAAVAATKDRTAYAEVLLGFITQGMRRSERYGVAMARHGRPDKRIDRVLDGTSISKGLARWNVAAILVLGCSFAYLAAATTPQTEEVFHFPALPASPKVLQPIYLAQAQAPAPQSRPIVTQKAPTFDAISIKSVPASAGRGGTKGPSLCPSLKFTTGRVYGEASVSKLIQEAYGLSQHQVSGGPSWVNSDHFCIEAKSAGPTEKDQLVLMLQSMLADRFQLVLRHETKEMPVYFMTVSKPGRLFELTPDQASIKSTTPQDLQAIGYKTYHEPDGSPAGVMFDRNTMQGYAAFLSQDPGLISDRPVVDRTGLTGTYLLFVQFGANDNFLNAIAEQFGLKFDASKAPLPAVVIEGISKPSEN